MATAKVGDTTRTSRLQRRLRLGLAVGLGVSVLVIALRATPPLQVAEAETYDFRTRWIADPAEADTSIVIVAVDDNSLEVYADRLGRWPWPRDVYDGLLRFFELGGARLVVFDITFPEPDLSAPVADTMFAEAMVGTGLAVLPFTLSPGNADSAAAWEANRAATPEGAARLAAAREALVEHALPAGSRAEGGVPSLPYAERPDPLFGSAAASLGVITWNPDPDGVSRRERLVYEHQGRLYPSLPLAAARALEPGRFGGDVRVTDGRLSARGATLPLDDGRFVIPWHGRFLAANETTYPVIPVFHVLNSYVAVATGREPDISPDRFAGKTVFVAATGIGAFEARATPLASNDPGVMVHVSVLDGLLSGDYIRRAPWAANAVAAAAVSTAAALLAALAGGVAATVGTLLLLGLTVAAATLALGAGLWLDLAAPLLGGGLAFAGAMVANYLTEGREKRRVRDLFGRYVSPEYVARLADDFESVRLGGERVPVTLLFSDIRGFTSLSEQLPAETVIEMLNEYLEKMAEVVFRHGGTLDKFIGDAVMAFWGAPVPVEDHARRAVEASLDMLEELDRLNERWQSTGAPTQLRIGIGINTGEAIVGNIGSLTRKLDYTAIGDTVNLASRLEGLNKEYGTSIIISEATRARLAEGEYDTRPIDSVKVKGKEQAVEIYELRGRARKPARAGVAAGALALALLALGAGSTGAMAQQTGQDARLRWSDWVYQPGAWRGGSLVELTTRNAATDSLALVARVEAYAIPPRWRAEYRKVVGDSLGAPVIVIFDDATGTVLTSLGSTPFGEHAASDDALLQAVIARVQAGRPQPPAGRVPVTADDGAVRYVIVRKPAARAEFAESLLATGTAGRAGRSLLRLGMHAIGGERSEEVVASAGARGVATIRTVDGEITVMPDSAAVRRMEGVEVGILELDRFLRQAGIAPPAGEAKEEEGA